MFAAYAALSYLAPIQAGDFSALWSFARLGSRDKVLAG